MDRYEYALLALRKQTYERVTYPDGTVRDVKPSEGNSAVEAWQQEQRERFVRDLLPVIQSDRLTAQQTFHGWRAEVRVDAAKVRVGGWAVFGLYSTERRITFPASDFAPKPYVVRVAPVLYEQREVTFVVLGGAAEHTEVKRMFRDKNFVDLDRSEVEAIIAKEFPGWQDLKAPQPKRGQGSVEEAEFARWLSKLASGDKPALIVDQKRWNATLYTESGPVPVTEPLPYAEFGLAVLNQLGREGWRLAATAEDKGLYKGEDAPNESGAAAVRYMLMRPRRPKPVNEAAKENAPASDREAPEL